MTSRLLLLSSTALVLTALLSPATAMAQSISAEEAAQLRAELAALRAQVEKLEARIAESEKKTHDSANLRIADDVDNVEIAGNVQNIEIAGSAQNVEVAGSAQNVEVAGNARNVEVGGQSATTAADSAKPKTQVTWKGAPESKSDDGWSFKVRGRILYDVATVSAPNGIEDDGLGFSHEIRRARIGAQGKMPGGFGYKFEIDLADNREEFTDLYIDYQRGNFTITVGQHHPFTSLEELSSSNDTSFIERAAFTDAFGFERRLGASLAYAQGAVLAQAGVFTANIEDIGADNGDANNAVSFDGRLVFAPKLGAAQVHLGGSVHFRSLNDSTDQVRYRQRPLTHTSDTRFLNTDRFSADKENSYGLEGALIYGRFHTAIEAHWLQAVRPQADRLNGESPTFFGFAAEAGIFLTNDTREYKGGVFKGVKVANPVSKGGWGALQLNVRYDRLDLNDAGIVGGIQDGFMASLIWTPINNIRLMMNYGHLSYRDAALDLRDGTSDYKVNVFVTRAQVSF